MATERSIAKDFHDLMKNIKSFSDGQATVTDWDDENLGTFQVTIAPNGGIYKEGEFIFKIVTDCIDDPPRVYCQTAIYHPNIDTMTDCDGEICINLFDCDLWNSNFSMQDVVQGLLFLMYEPNVDDPLNSAIMCGMNLGEFEENARKAIAGDRVGDYLFPVNPRYARLHPANPAKDGEKKDEEKGMEDRNGKEDDEEKGMEDRNGKEDDEEKGVEEKDGKGDDGDKVRTEEADGQKVERIEDVKNNNEEERTEGEKDETDEGDKEKTKENPEMEVEYEDRYFGIKVVVSAYSDDEDYDEEDEDEDEDEADEDLLDDDIENDDTVVNDDELDDIIDKLNDEGMFVDDENRKNLDASENVISWSRMFYGADNRTDLDHALVFIKDQTSGPGTVSQGACKEPDTSPGPSTTRTLRKVHMPTVATRFYSALQTRIFRRWLV